MYTLQRLEAPTAEPITVDQAKTHCRVETDADDVLFEVYIKAAREHCEKVTGRALIEQTWKLSLDRFPCWLDTVSLGRSTCLVPNWLAVSAPSILLPKPKLIAVTEITYIDTTGADQTLDSARYKVSAGDDSAKIYPAYGQTWPCALPSLGSVQITYTAGYGANAEDVPAVIQLAMLLLVGHFYENREATQQALTGNGPLPLPIGVDDLLSDETIVAFTHES